MELVTITDNYPLPSPGKIIISNSLVKCRLVKDKIPEKWYDIDQYDNNWKRPERYPVQKGWPDTVDSWIWPSFPAGQGDIALFRRKFKVPDGVGGIVANLEIAADDLGEIYLNGERIPGRFSFNKISEVNLNKYIRTGVNLLAIKVINSKRTDGYNMNPAGLYFKLTLFYDALEPVYPDQIIDLSGMDTNSNLYNKTFQVREGTQFLKGLIKIPDNMRTKLFLNGHLVFEYNGIGGVLNITEYLIPGLNRVKIEALDRMNQGYSNFQLILSYTTLPDVAPYVYRKVYLEDKTNLCNDLDNILDEKDYKQIKTHAEQASKDWYEKKNYTYYQGYHFGKYVSFHFKQHIIKVLRYMNIANKIIKKHPAALYILKINDSFIYKCFKEVFTQQGISFINYNQGLNKINERWNIPSGNKKDINFVKENKNFSNRKTDKLDLLLLDHQLDFNPEVIDFLKGKGRKVGVIHYQNIYNLLKQMGIEAYFFTKKDKLQVFPMRWKEIKDDKDLINIFIYKNLYYYSLVVNLLSFYFNNIMEEILGIYFSLESSPFTIKKILLTNDKMFVWHFMADYGRKNNIKTIVNQHGVIFGSHGYLPLEADEIICWGPRSRQWFISNGIEENRLKVMGSTRLSKYNRDNINDTGEYILGIMEFTEFYSPKQSYLDNIKLLSIMRGISKILEEQILIKLHPGQGDDEKIFFEKLLKINGIKSVKIEKTGDISSYIKKSNIILAGRSTTVLEGILSGKPVIILATDREKLKENEFIKTGLFPGGISAKEIADLLNKFKNRHYRKKVIEEERNIIDEYLGKDTARKSIQVLKYLLS